MNDVMTTMAAAVAMVGLMTCVGAGPLSAQAAPATPTPTPVEKIGDWELVCLPATIATDGKPAKPSCRLVQNHTGEGGGTVLLVSIVWQDAKGPVAIVSVPEGVYLAPGIELTVDKGQSFKLLYETCNPSGCHAGYKIAGEIGAALKKGTTANHKIFDSKQQPVTISASLKGFSKALERLQEASK